MVAAPRRRQRLATARQQQTHTIPTTHLARHPTLRLAQLRKM
eukprot:COSAG06_NODE_10579_length_1655_cov_2.097044_1_plen_41_part_10